jgi:hypothetical protein
MATTALEQCRCGRPLHPYWVRQEGGSTMVYTQRPILPGESTTVWASDLAEARIALGLQPGTLVHDVHFTADRTRDRQGACLRP